MPARKKKAEDQPPQGPELPQLRVHRLMPVDALAIRGRHNAMNALAALALARAIDCPLAPMMHALRRYSGEPHRLQLIATIDGVEYYDDSKGTNVGATVAALEGLGSRGQEASSSLLGGDGKGQNFCAAGCARRAPCACRRRRWPRRCGYPCRARGACRGRPAVGCAHSRAGSLDCSRPNASMGTQLLLSPACASFDMFRNYVHRGEVLRTRSESCRPKRDSRHERTAATTARAHQWPEIGATRARR